MSDVRQSGSTGGGRKDFGFMTEYNDSSGRNSRTVWKDRKHFMWFPFSFTKYELKNDRLYEQRGFFSTSYDELLLYRVVDLSMRQTLTQKLFGTGTLILKCRVDATPEIYLENIRNPKEVKDMLSELIEDARTRHRVVGREFYGAGDCCEETHEHGRDWDEDDRYE